MKAFDYAIARNESGALEALKHGYKLKGSGLDLVDLLKERILPEDKLVSLHQVDSLKFIRAAGGGYEIGGSATLQEISNHEGLAKDFAVVAKACGDAATPAVRAVATAAGNICQRPRCWYFRAKEFPCLKKGGSTCFAVDGENRYHALFGGGPCHIVHASNLAPALVAVDGEVVTKSARGEGRTIAAGDFFRNDADGGENVLREDELITHLRLAKKPRMSGYVEFKEKQSFDWPIAGAAVARMEDGWRVVLAAVSPEPWRAAAAEEVLGTADGVSPDLAERAADAAVEGAEPMSQNGWRLKLVRAAVRRALLAADGKETMV